MGKDRRARALLPVIVVLFWFAQYIYIPFQTPFLTAIGVSAGFIGVIVGAYGVSQMALRLPVGVMADHVGRHRGFILLGGLFAGIASLVRVALYDGVGFLVGNLFSGLASAMWISFMVRYTGFYPPEEQQKATARIILYNNAGMLAGFICGTLLYGRTSMRLLCALSAVAGLLAAALAALMEPEHPEGNRPGVAELLPVCLNRRLIFFSLLAVVQQGVQMSTTMSFTNQVLKGLGATDAVIGAASIFYMLSAVGFAYLASSRLVVKLGPRSVVAGCFGVLSVYCLLVPTARGVRRLCAADAAGRVHGAFVLHADGAGHGGGAAAAEVHGHGLFPGGVRAGHDAVPDRRRTHGGSVGHEQRLFRAVGDGGARRADRIVARGQAIGRFGRIWANDLKSCR